ncbi:MAG: hypothetical protein DRG59_02645 [Deltaproteobacteria bacterium]|nr:MAG: hypothetical protein DRG59_02645 [Deltaproteobacteria bacterium]
MNFITDSLQKKKKQLEESLAPSPEQNASLVEVALMSLYNMLANRFVSEANNLRKSGTIVAIGHFGRRLLGIHSPVEVLLIMDPERDRWRNEWFEGIFYPLRDAGWELVTLSGSLKEIMQKAEEDFAFFQSLLFSRFISGNREFFNDFREMLDELIDRKRDEFLPKLRDQFENRRKECSSEEYWLEPDLFYNPGGIHDILGIQSAAYVGFKAYTLEDAIFQGLLTRQELDWLSAASDFFMNIVNLLQTMKKRYLHRLGFLDQIEVADRLGYEEKGGFQAVEVFMRELHKHLDSVKIVIDLFWTRFEELEEVRGEPEVVREVSKKEIYPGLRAERGKLYVSPAKFQATEKNLLLLFDNALKYELKLSSQAIQWCTHHLNALNMSSLYDEEVRSVFWDIILSDKDRGSMLRTLYNLRVLHALVPELETVHALVEHDSFHVFPVHEHHLQTYEVVKKLLSGEYENREPELTQIAQRIRKPGILLLAAFLHDIGKAGGGDHAEVGGRIVVPIAQRLGLNEEDTEFLQFLVHRHVLLVENASLRDLSDEEMLRKSCEIIINPERLDHALLLSFAVMKSLGSNAQQKWETTPVQKLYHLIRHRMEKGEPDEKAIEERLSRLKSEVYEKVKDFMSEADLEKHFKQLAGRYLLAVTPDTMVKHLKLEAQLDGKQITWEVEKLRKNEAELTIVTRESLGFLAKAAGVITLHDLDIREAQIFTKDNGVLLVIFHLLLPRTTEEYQNWDVLLRDLEKVVGGKIAIDYRIASKALKDFSEQRGRTHWRPSKVLIDNESSEKYTILEVYSDDRPGLLYTITKTLVDMQLRIFVAKISTQIDQAVDVFYVRTADGKKMEDTQQIEEIENALKFWLDTHLF